jgi:hypothetical protein
MAKAQRLVRARQDTGTSSSGKTIALRTGCLLRREGHLVNDPIHRAQADGSSAFRRVSASSLRL